MPLQELVLLKLCGDMGLAAPFPTPVLLGSILLLYHRLLWACGATLLGGANQPHLMDGGNPQGCRDVAGAALPPLSDGSCCLLLICLQTPLGWLASSRKGFC